jgi:hypothetical protein
VIAGLAVFIAVAVAGEPPDKATREKEWQAVQTCQAAIAAKLHDPRSAEWPGLSRSYRQLKGGAYTVQVEVRARNAFNALRLGTYECRINAASMKLTSVKQISP